jgi:LuxR family transcriptional regulator, maltose regulon positive regulatory protein
MAGSTPEPDATGAVLETRFYRPRWRPGQVPRPRLVERLQRGARSKLILVSAPPGFGKTTLLAEWLAAPSSDERRVAWLSLDQSDDQPATFWLHVLTALQREQPTLGNVALSLLTSPQPPPITSLLALVLNEVAALPYQLVLVLDDYHVIEAGQIQTDVAFLLDHLPPQLHLVIASRADPAVPLGRLRARGELAEIRAADLRFTVAEATVFLNQAMGL